MLWRVRKHGETCWRGVLERSGGLDSGARARPTVDVGAWAVMPRRTREAVHVGADATGGGCARESRSTSERLDCVRECGKQGQQLRARVGEAWGGGEIVRSSHPRTGEQGGGREGVCSRAPSCLGPGLGQPPTSPALRAPALGWTPGVHCSVCPKRGPLLSFSISVTSRAASV